MAQATWADELAGHAQQQATEEDLWHVAVAADEVKVMTLEKLDDLYRLSIIDAETRVWQPGMDEWVPLGVIAGLDSEPEPDTATTTNSFPPPLPSPAASSFPPPLPAPAFVSAAPAVPRSAIPTVRTQAVQTPASVRPVSMDDLPMLREGGGFGQWLLTLAIVAGVAVTLYRNDVVRSMAHSVGQDALYLKLEQALGGPSFGTPRAIAKYASAHLTPSAIENLKAPAAAPTTTPTTTVIGGSVAPAAPKATAADRSTARDQAPETAKPSKAEDEPITPESLANAPDAKAVEKQTTPAKLNKKPAPTRAVAKPSAKKRTSTGGTGIKGSSDAYDPLNGKL